jgi:uncharacterized protein YdhG (YjbR/CyaY superfamily)
MTSRFGTVDEYLSSFPPEVQVVLEETRETIRDAAPGSEEKISYGIPTFTLGGKTLVYLAGWKQHVGLYPIPRLDGPLEDEVSPYRSGKDTVRFPLREPIPYDLVQEMVQVLVSRRSG